MKPPRIEIPEKFNAATHFIDRHTKEGRGDKIAIYYKDKKITYREVQEMVNQTGNALRNLGVEIENRVLLLLLDCPEFIYSFFGAIKIGAVPIPINTVMSIKDYHYFLEDSRGKVLIVSEEMLPQIEPIKNSLTYLKHIVVVGKEQRGYVSYDKLISDASSELEAANTSRDDACFWLYSSGSTGAPKGTVHLQHDMLYHAECYVKPILEMTEDDITFSASKLFFAYGLGNSMYFPLHIGASTVLLSERPKPDAVFETVTKYKPTNFFGVPTLYASMLEVEDAERKYDVSSVRLCISAGEALPADIYRRWKKRFGIEILDGIGSTEILHIHISNRLGAIKPGSTGLVVPGYEAKIVDGNGKEVERGKVGILMIKGDSTAAYYWNKHEKTKYAMRGEWFYTGDTYYQDEDGYFWYAGRGDDMLKVGGIWVSPVEVESTLVEHEAVLECAVVGAPDEKGLIKTKSFVVLRRGYEASAELAKELQEFVKGKIAPYKYPRWVEFVKELPKTATGKIQRFKLRGK
jgi:benzoate-CoA ligase